MYLHVLTVTSGGWIVTYILEVRKGSAEGASWVASAFYLGEDYYQLAALTVSMLTPSPQVLQSAGSLCQP